MLPTANEIHKIAEDRSAPYMADLTKKIKTVALRGEFGTFFEFPKTVSKMDMIMIIYHLTHIKGYRVSSDLSNYRRISIRW